MSIKAHLEFGHTFGAEATFGHKGLEVVAQFLVVAEQLALIRVYGLGFKV